jgi:hypothetical protein
MSFISPVVDLANATYSHDAFDASDATTGVEYDVGGVHVMVISGTPKCARFAGVGFGLAGPLPVAIPYSVPANLFGDSMFSFSVTISGTKVAVDPGELILKDQTGQMFRGHFADMSTALEAQWRDEFETACASDSYDLVMGGVSSDGQRIEMPSVHFVRKAVYVHELAHHGGP